MKEIDAGPPHFQIEKGKKGTQDTQEASIQNFYGNYQSSETAALPEIRKGVDLSSIHKARVPGYHHTLYLDKKQDQIKNRAGCSGSHL